MVPNLLKSETKNSVPAHGAYYIDYHGFRQREDFNKIFNVSIIDNSSPKTLEVREHKYIQLLKTLKPLGINTINPFGLPLLLTS